MAVSKRIRYEVLRRDGFTCRYCGAKAPDVELQVDHVMPASLGGGDTPGNLVTACRDCNIGKASSRPDEDAVADISRDALRWARAMKEAAIKDEHEREAELDVSGEFYRMWRSWESYDDEYWLPIDWSQTILRQLKSGLTMADLEYAIDTTMTVGRPIRDRFLYFLGICKHILAKRIESAHSILTEDEASDG